MPNKDKGQIRIISPAGRFQAELLDTRLKELEALGLPLSYHKLSPDPSWPFTAGSRLDRLEQLQSALRAPEIKYLMSVRGGYGVSDLLDGINWDQCRAMKPKAVIGFSDISALHSAFYTKLGWNSIHGPMPATELWRKHGDEDVRALLDLLLGKRREIELPLLYEGKGLPPRIEGPAFGGCLSVLTNLIGTPYFPKSLDDHILYWEDISEHPARVMRFVNQWLQSGALKGVRGLILGRFVGSEVEGLCTEAHMRETLVQRLNIPVWFCPLFGHCSPNWPLPVGWPIEVDGDRLRWTMEARIGSINI